MLKKISDSNIFFISAIYLAIIISLICILLAACSESDARNGKTQESNRNGGLNRVLKAYSYSGELLKSYEGKFDIESTEGGKVLFDLNGKRTIIYNAIVVCDEK